MSLVILTITFRISGGNLNHPTGVLGSVMANEGSRLILSRAKYKIGSSGEL